MQTYSPELKAQVIAAFAMGKPQAAIAREMKLSRSTVRLWTRDTEPVPVATSLERRQTLGELVAEYLDTGLRAAIAFHQRLADPKYPERTEPVDQRADYAALMDRWFGMARGIVRERAAGESTESAQLPVGTGGDS